MKAVLSAKVGNNDELIPDVCKLHVKSTDVVADVTYGNGVFWKNVDTSKFAAFYSTDLKHGVDFRQLPYDDASVDVVVLDPPYMYNPKSTIKKSLSTGYRLNESGVDIRTTEDVLRLYRAGMVEAKRVLRVGGRLLVKCKDGIESGKQRWEHIRIFGIATRLELAIVDLFVLVQPTQPAIRWPHQKHARKNHSYLWVFRKEAQMEASSVSGRVNAIIAAVLDVDDVAVLPTARLREELGANEDDVWTLMLRLEDELDVHLGYATRAAEPCRAWLTVGDVIDYCEAAAQAHRA